MKSNIARVLLIVGILALGVLGFVGMHALAPEPPKREAVARPPLVETLVLEDMSTSFAVRSQGTVRPRTETALSAEISGTIVEVSPQFIPGGVFDAGQSLLRIDPTNYLVAVEQAEALVKQRQLEYDGAQKLLEQGYRAEAEAASAAAALASAKAELTRARRDLQRTYIRLPYAGMVRDKAVDLGQFVSPGTRLGTVFATDYAEVRLPLTDQELAFIDLPGIRSRTDDGADDGPAVTLSAVRKGEPHEWRARIVRTEGVVDETSRVTYAVARVEDPYQFDGELEPLPMGTFVSARIEGRQIEGVVRVPRNIIRGADELIFVDEDGRLRIREVQIVHADADYAYIGDGAVPGERVLVTALDAPVNGMAVRIGDGDAGEGEPRIASSEEGAAP
jgi:RND family efflux transporter MFP subunit